MAGRIRDEDVALVRERSAIGEVVGEYLQLRTGGADSLKGLCPFHEEKTPSFNVTPSKGLWYCFSEGEGGDVIKFVQKIDNLGFTEAVERLAKRAGIELRYEQGGHIPGQEQSHRRRLIEAHKAAAEFYAEQLDTPAAATGRDFLSSRGFELADARRFGVGYAPAEWEALTRHLRGRGFTEAELLAGGLVSQGRRGPIDRFRGRLMWPIADLTGDVIAFGARKLAADEDGPKYLNSPETPLFKKSSVLYGADLARREIAQHRQAVVVEGYTDVMACHLAGIGTAVATSGTSFGEGHITILRRLLMDDSQFRGEVIFTFDGDAAGQRAALRAFSLEERFVTQTFVAVQRDGLDPCDLRLQRGDAAVRDLIAQREPLFEFAIRSVLREHNLDTAEGRLAALDAAAPIVRRIKDRGLRRLYALSLDRWIGMMDEGFVLDRVLGRGGQPEVRGSRPRQQRRRPDQPGRRARFGSVARWWWRERQAERRPTVPFPSRPGRMRSSATTSTTRSSTWNARRSSLLSSGRRSAGPDSMHCRPRSLPCPRTWPCAISSGRAAESAGAGSAREWAERLLAAAPNDSARAFVTRLAVEPIEVAGRTGEPDATFAEKVLAQVEELAVNREIASLKSRLQRLNPVNEPGYNRIFGDLVALEQRHKVLLERATGGQ